MKLFAKYNRINLVATIFIFLLASAAFYFLINYIVINQVDDDLRIEQREIQTYAAEHTRLPEIVPVKDQMTSYLPATEPLKKRSFKSLVMLDSVERERGLFRQLNFPLKTAGQWYTVSISKSLEQIDKLVHSILLITLSTIFLILITAIIINRIVLKKLWKPFYDTLHSIKDFKVSKDQRIILWQSSIEEFTFMNSTLEQTMNQARQEYFTLKEFTENASHEMQTPLAVIRSKLDLMIQDEELTEQQSQTLQSTYNAIQKLTRLNQSLLLLAKIENNQYEETEMIDLDARLKEKIEEFRELWQARDLRLSINIQPSTVKMNNQLADILLNNILGNATKHNCNGGKIAIELNSLQLSVTNTSDQPTLDPNKLFTRFYKPGQNNEHNGLGLSIIKQICNVSGFDITYSFKEGEHSFLIKWK